MAAERQPRTKLSRPVWVKMAWHSQCSHIDPSLSLSLSLPLIVYEMTRKNKRLNYRAKSGTERGCNERARQERKGKGKGRHSACDATNDEIIRDCQLLHGEGEGRKEKERRRRKLQEVCFSVEEIANSKYNQRNYNSEGRGRGAIHLGCP